MTSPHFSELERRDLCALVALIALNSASVIILTTRIQIGGVPLFGEVRDRAIELEQQFTNPLCRNTKRNANR